MRVDPYKHIIEVLLVRISLALDLETKQDQLEEIDDARQEAIEDLREQAEEESDPRNGVIIDLAKDEYGSGDTQFDDNPRVLHADQGSYVSAWLWVSDVLIDGALENADTGDPNCSFE